MAVRAVVQNSPAYFPVLRLDIFLAHPILQAATANPPSKSAHMNPTASLNGVQTRKKRVLPTRSRRGGPGVGSCDIDLMILDTHKRRSEGEPLVPADTPFLLTTDSALADELSSNPALDLNVQANERYFDRPEVLKAFREQLIIETPHFVHVADLPSVGVGGRFRPRGSGDNLIDTSDAAYEKRHRKYESFEKRLRLREKEKLKHEHYKLKERIEQLRSMDGSAFLSLPASDFTPLDVHVLDEEEEINIQDEHPNGTSGEGERRRKEMLDVALTLEERYRALLPPERIRKATTNTWSEQENRTSEEKEEPTSQAAESSKAKETTGIKLKFRVPNPQYIMTSPPTHQTPVKKAKQPALPPPRPSPLRQATSHCQAEEPPPINIPEPSDTFRTTQAEGTLEPATIPSPRAPASGARTSALPASSPATPMSNPDIAVLEPNTSPGTTSAQEDDIPLSIRVRMSVRPFKRPRLSPSPTSTQKIKDFSPQSPSQTISVPITSTRETSVPPIESINTSSSTPLFLRIKQQKQKPLSQQKTFQKPRQPYTTRREETVCLLMVAAVRSSAGTKSRNQMRHITAFGAKVPQAVDELKEFELPDWVRESEDEGDDEDDEDEDENDDEDEDDGDDESSRRSVDPEQYDELEHNMMSDASPLAKTNAGHQASSPHPNFLSFEPPIEVLDIPESSVRDGS